MNTQLVLVEFRNNEPFIYEIESDKPITLDSVVKYFEVTEGWDEERDNITFVDKPSVIKI